MLECDRLNKKSTGVELMEIQIQQSGLFYYFYKIKDV